MNHAVKKILNISLKVVTWLIVVFTVFMLIFTVITVTTVDRNDRSIFGLKFYIVQSDSMSLSENNKDMDVHFNAGDIVIIKNVKDPTQFEEGDVIAFMSSNSTSYGETVTHMIREVKKTEDGRVVGYVTFGTNTGTDDEELVEPSYVLGKYSGRLAGFGNFFAFVRSTPGYVVCILVPFMLLILYNGINVIRLFRKYKREQTEEIQAERDKIDAERAENQRMMAELIELKAQLAKREEENNSPAEPAFEASPAEEATAETISENAHTETISKEADAAEKTDEI